MEVTPNPMDCTGSHRFFVADVVGVEPEGKVHLFLVCTSCGEVRHESYEVAPKGAPLTIEKRT